jgi:hypothetical protein
MEVSQMQTQNETSSLLRSAHLSADNRRVVLTVSQFSERNPAFSESALRNLIFKADERLGANGPIPSNGLIEAGAIVRIGRKVLIDEARFFDWIEAQQGGRK